MSLGRLLPYLLFLLTLVAGSGGEAAWAWERNAPLGEPILAATDLPPEARETLAMIRRGGPFPYPKDGSVFGNFEKRLPIQPRGYYREYTVDTPGAHNRGARRLIAGGQPPVVFYYTDDHYRSFHRLRD